MKKKKERDSKINGSVILEYTIVFPLVLLVIFALFYAGFILHQRSTLDGAVNRGTIYAAKLLSDPQYSTIVKGVGANGDALDCESSSYSFSSKFDIQPYRYIFSYNGGSAKEPVVKKVKNIVQANSFWGGTSNLTVDYSYKNYVLYQEITIAAKQEFPLPDIFKLVGLDDHIEISSTSVQAVTDPDEFIRNVDLTIDVIEMVTGTDVDGTIKNVVSKISKFAQSLFGTGK